MKVQFTERVREILEAQEDNDTFISIDNLQCYPKRWLTYPYFEIKDSISEMCQISHNMVELWGYAIHKNHCKPYEEFKMELPEDLFIL